MSRIKQDMQNTLCLRIHKEAKEIIDSPNVAEIKKYHKLFKHIQNSDKTISRCFDGWKRSDIALKISQLLAENLLTDEHIQNLSDKTNEYSFQKMTALQIKSPWTMVRSEYIDEFISFIKASLHLTINYNPMIYILE